MIWNISQIFGIDEIEKGGRRRRQLIEVQQNVAAVPVEISLAWLLQYGWHLSIPY
jgi:hypothetical protein